MTGAGVVVLAVTVLITLVELIYAMTRGKPSATPDPTCRSDQRRGRR